MKLRTSHNSIRIRIRKSELAILQEKHQVEESIKFLDGVIFKFALIVDKNASSVGASLIDNTLTLSISNKDADEWINSNQVGIERHIDLSDGEQLHLLIEKDFPCLDRPEEDKSDTFWELAPETPEAC